MDCIINASGLLCQQSSSRASGTIFEPSFSNKIYISFCSSHLCESNVHNIVKIDEVLTELLTIYFASTSSGPRQGSFLEPCHSNKIYISFVLPHL